MYPELAKAGHCERRYKNMSILDVVWIAMMGSLVEGIRVLIREGCHPLILGRSPATCRFHMWADPLRARGGIAPVGSCVDTCDLEAAYHRLCLLPLLSGGLVPLIFQEHERPSKALKALRAAQQ